MLLENVWRGQGHKVIVGIRNKVVKQYFFADTQQALLGAELLDGKGWDVYFAPATYSEHNRTAASVQDINALWLDLDAGPGKPYKKWTHALLALLQWTHTNNIQKPSAVVLSGGGAHVYWVLDTPCSRAEWLPVAQHLKQALALAGVHADPARTADAASIMRVPGTRNHKTDAARPVVTLYEGDRRVSLRGFQAALPQVGPLRTVIPAPRGEWAVPIDYPPGDADLIARQCGQMQSVRDVAGDSIPEPYWRAALSVLTRCVGGETLIHIWSQGDPRYTPQETERKAAGTGGPATCKHFNEVNPGGCVGCPQAGLVTSPIQLGVATPAAAPTPEEPWRVNKVGRFVCTDQGIYYTPPADGAETDGPLRVSHVPFWIVEVRERARLDTEADEASLMVEWRTINGLTKRGVVRQADVYDMKAFVKWLANHGLMPALVEVKLFMAYISQLSLSLVRKQGSREYYESLGWHKDGFVIGPTLINAEGSKPALVQSTSPIAHMQAMGTEEGWKAAVAPLCKPEYAPHAFALLAGFGSPILHLAGVQSAVVSLAGPSGAGKTLAAKLALSIYGNPALLMQPASATTNAVDMHLSVNRHVPFLWDETTHCKPARLADFIYTAANGQSKSALTRTRDFRQGLSHALVAFITSNHPVLDFAQRDIEEAHRRRILELLLRNVMEKADADILHAAVEQHHGAVAETYLTTLYKLKDRIPAMFEQALQTVRGQSLVPDSNRFGLWTLAAALVGGAIAKSVGLIAFDPLPVVQAALTDLKDAAWDVQTDDVRAQESLSEFLTANSRNVNYWEGHKGGLGVPIDNPVARVLEDAIAIPCVTANRVWEEERIGRSMLKSWMKEAVRAVKNVRLSPGTPAVRCYVFNKSFIDIGDSDD